MKSLAIEELPDELWDVVVVGAGPAGATAAIHLAAKGHRVLLLDRDRFPREKVCGDALASDTFRYLRNAGLDATVREAAHEVGAVSVFSPSMVEVAVDTAFLTLKRSRLDALLAERAVDAGAVFCHGEVDGLVRQADGTVAASLVGCGGPARARFAIIATGANVRLAARLGMIARPAASADAVRCYVRSPVAFDRMLAFYLPRLLPGYGWIFPMGGGEYNVGCAVFRPSGERACGSLRSAFEEFSSRFPPVRELFRAAEAVTPIRGARSRCGLEGTRRLVEGNVLAVGETIGSTLLFTGEGVGTAMHTGELAAIAVHEALSAGSPERLELYPRLVREELRPRHMAYRAAQKVASVGWLNDFVSRLGRKGGCLHPLVASATSDQSHSRSVRFLRRLVHWLAR